MAFNSIRPTADAEDVEQIINALTGVSGAGQAISLTQLSDSSNYALDVRNLDTTNGYGLRVRDGASANLLLAYKNNVVIGATAADSLTIYATTYIGDTSNANNIYGLTINQAAGVDEILSFKASFVAHGMTALTETDTYGALKPYNATSGGVALYGWTDATDTPVTALALYGTLGNAAATTKSTAGKGVVNIIAAVKSTTSNTTVGADGNLLTVSNGDTTRFILDAEGSAHADVEWTTYDTHDDVALLNKLDAALTRDPVKTAFGAYLGDYRDELQDAKIVNFYDPEGPRAMVNFTRLAMLHTGALRQLGQRLALAESKLAALPAGNR